MKRKHRGTRYFYIVTYIVMILVTAVVTIGFLRVYLKSDPRSSRKEQFDKYYVLITDDRDSSFWQSVYKGAADFGLKRNVYVENLGEGLSADYSKTELMQMAIASKVDGIILNADESDEMNTLINTAVEANIPVVTVSNDCSNSKRISYVEVGNYALSKEYSKQIMEIAGDLLTEEGRIVNVTVIVNSVPTSGQSIISAGIQESIESSVDFNERISLEMVAVDDENPFAVEESIRDLFMQGNLPDIVICLNELDTTCVYQAVLDFNKVGQIHILGYYDSTTILQGIDRGIIDSTIKIDTKELGEYSVEALLDYGTYGFVSQYSTVDIILINNTNIREYYSEDTNETQVQ